MLRGEGSRVDGNCGLGLVMSCADLDLHLRSDSVPRVEALITQMTFQL